MSRNKESTSLGLKYQLSIILLFIVVMVINFLWVYRTRKSEVVDLASEKAGIIVKEFIVAIEFTTSSEIAGDIKSPGKVHQSTLNVGEVGQRFSEILGIFTNFTIRLISDNPRNIKNLPDDYENGVLQAFKKDPLVGEIYEEATIDGKQYLRYLVPLRVNRSCLICHGEPKGEIDVTGFEKEGMQIGDLRGAVSLTLPIYTEYKHMKRHLINVLIFYLFITVLGAALFFYILRKLLELNKKVNAKNVQLKKQHNLLQEYESDKSNLIEMLVHDLRNPLTSISGGLEIAISSGAIEDEKLLSILNMSHSGTERLSNMISDILDVSKMEEQKFTPQYKMIDLEPYLNNLYANLQLGLKGRINSFDLVIKNKLPRFVVDPELLKRIIENIVYNAERHSHPDAAVITISAQYLPEDDELQVSISDNGKGIPKEYLDKVFDKFMQVASRDSVILNKGLGLTFCKFAVTLMGGKIWVESELYKGAAFHFTVKNGDEDKIANNNIANDEGDYA